MKYVVFVLALLGMIPAAIMSAVNRRLFMLLPICFMLPVVVYQQTSINPISFEDYRGTVRGYEVNSVYLAGILILAAILLRGRKISLAPDWGARLYLLYFAWSCLSLMNVESMLVAGAEVWKMVMMYVVFLAVYNWLKIEKDPRPFLVGFALVFLGQFEIVVREHLVGIYQVRGSFMHQNSFALYLLMGLPLFFSYYLNSGRRERGKWLFALAFFLGSGCLVRTYSRGSIACYPIALAVVLFLSLRRNFNFRQIRRLVPLCALGLVGFLLILPRVIDRFVYAPESSGNTRVNFARCALNMIRAEPLFGVGLNNWGIKVNPPYPYWKGTGLREGIGDDPTFKDGIVETVYLLVCAECGIPALLVMLAWYAYYVISCRRLVRRLAGTSWFFLPVGLLGGLTGAFLQSTLEWVLKQSVNFSEMMIFFAMISFLNGNWKELREREAEAKKQRLLKIQEKKKAKEIEHA